MNKCGNQQLNDNRACYTLGHTPLTYELPTPWSSSHCPASQLHRNTTGTAAGYSVHVTSFFLIICILKKIFFYEKTSHRAEFDFSK